MGPGGFFPTNPDLADFLGDTHFDFENLYFWDFLGFQIPRFPGPQKSGLGQAWAGLWAGPGLDRAGPGLGRAGPSGPLRWAPTAPGWALGPVPVYNLLAAE